MSLSTSMNYAPRAFAQKGGVIGGGSFPMRPPGADPLDPLNQNVTAAQGLLQYNLNKSPDDEALKATNRTAAGVYANMETANPNVSSTDALRARIHGAGLISAGGQAGYDAGVLDRNRGILSAYSALNNANSELSRGLFSQQDFNNQDSSSSFMGGGTRGGGGSGQGPVSLGGGSGAGSGNGGSGIYTDGKRGYNSSGQRIRGTVGIDGKWAPRTNLDGSVKSTQWGL